MQADVLLETPRIEAIAASQTRIYVALRNQVKIYSREMDLERTVKLNIAHLAYAPQADQLVVVTGSKALVYSGDLRTVKHTFDTGSAAACAAGGTALAVASKRRIRWFDGKEHTLALPGVKAMAVSENFIYCVQHDKLLAVDMLRQVVRQVPVKFSMGWTSTASICTVGAKAVLAVDNRTWLVEQLRPYELPQAFSGVIGLGKFWLGFGPSQVLLMSDSSVIDTIDICALTGCGVLALNDEQKAFGLLATKESLVSIEPQIDAQFILKLAESDPKLATSLGAHLQGPELGSLRATQAQQAFDNSDYLGALELFKQAELSPLEICAKFEPLIDSLQPDIPSPSSITSRLLIPPVEALTPYLSAQHRAQLLRPDEPATMKAVDTLLFKCYCANKSPLVGALVRNKNYCDIDLVVSKLTQLGRFTDLVGFYKSRSEHNKALELIAKHLGPVETVSYLEPLDDFALVKKYAPKALRDEPELAAVLFGDATYDAHQVFEFLSAERSPYAHDYLQGAIKDSTDPKLHQDMALWLLDNDPSALDAFLESSSVNAHTLLPKIPASMYHTRAILYSKLGRHTEVVDLLLEKGEFEKANEYAKTWHVLEYLWKRTQKQHPQQVGTLLNSVGHLLDPLLLKKLPDSTQMHELGPYFSHLAEHLQAQRSAGQLTAALSSTYVAQSTYQLAHLKDQWYEVESTTTCAQCHKRLGLAVAATWRRSIVHYGCIKEFMSSN